MNPGAIVDGVGLELSDGCVTDGVWLRKLVSESSPGQAIFEMAEDSGRLGQLVVKIKGQIYKSKRFNWKSTFGR